MEKKLLIEKAREFAQRSLAGENKEINKEDYYMFLISKFLLLKEMIIKKDSRHNTLYFNYTQNSEYLKAIKYIVDYVKRNGRIEKNSTTVVIEPEQYNNSELQFYIWVFNKIRDSLVHGKYDFDLNNGLLIIKNDHSNDNDPYVLNCQLPIEMLELFAYIATTGKFKYDEKEIIEYKNYSTKMRHSFGYYGNFDTKIIKNYNKYNYINNEHYNYRNIIDNTYNYSNIYDNNSNNYANISYNNYEYSRSQEDILESLIEIVKNSDRLTEEETKNLYKYLKSLGLINYDSKIDQVQIRRNSHPDKKYAEKLEAIINEISSILGLNKKPKDIVSFVAIYNYMQLTFSLNEFNFKEKQGKDILGYLKISKLNPEYIKYNERTREYEKNDNSEYSVKIKAIKTYTQNFILKMQGKILQYKKNPSPSFRQSINDLFKNYYKNIIHSFADKNAYVLTSIRNSIEHANIYDVNGYIMLKDKSNQNDNESMNFYCLGEKKDIFEITKSLELGIAKEEFTFEDFLEELKSVIDSQSFNELLSIINELKMINTEGLINVIKKASLKK